MERLTGCGRIRDDRLFADNLVVCIVLTRIREVLVSNRKSAYLMRGDAEVCDCEL